MRQIDLEHPGLLETIRRILSRENVVPKSSVRDFDGNEFNVTCEITSTTDEETGVTTYADPTSGKLFKGGHVLIEIVHCLSPQYFEKQSKEAKPFLIKILQRHFSHDPDCFLVGSGNEKATVTVKVATDNMTPEEVIAHKTVRKAAQLRLLVLYGPFLLQFERFLVSKSPSDKDVPFTQVPYTRNFGGGGNDTRMYLVCPNGILLCNLFMRVEDVDERIFVRAFLQEMQGMSGNSSKGLQSAVSMSYAQGNTPTSMNAHSAVLPKSGEDCFWVTFNISRSHMDPVERAEQTIRMICDFRAFLSYHISCCKGSLHTAMRKRAEASLQVINRAKTKTTGRPRINIQ